MPETLVIFPAAFYVIAVMAFAVFESFAVPALLVYTALTDCPFLDTPVTTPDPDPDTPDKTALNLLVSCVLDDVSVFL